jgi:hypothetical protein
MYRVKSNSPVRYGTARPAESTAPAYVSRSPQPYPTQGQAPASGHSSSSQYGGQGPRTSSPSTRAPSPQEHAAYNARTGTVGYGRSSRTPSPSSPPVPPWGIREDIKRFSLDVAKDNEGTQVTQFTAQGSCPGTNGGVCNAMTGEWIKHGAQNPSMQQASAAFGQTLHYNMPGLIEKQAQFEGRLGFLKSEQRQHKAEMSEQQKDLHDLTPFIQDMEAGRLSPRKARQVNSWVADLESRMNTTSHNIAETGARIAHAEKQEAASLGGGLPHTRTADNQRITEDFAHDLDRATQRPGFYALHMHANDGGSGHVMGMEVGAQGCKFMDPNTGEFATRDRKAMLNVAVDHVGTLYMNRNDRFSVDHFG